MRENPFFVVWNPASGQSRVRHESYPEALAEATRLARLNTGHRFYVLVSCSVVVVADPVQVTGLHHLYRDNPVYRDNPDFPNEVPF